MKRYMKIGYIIFSFSLVFYLLLPNPDFPPPPDDALQSNEPADSESLLRRAYFTNYTREEVMEHYNNDFRLSSFLGLVVPTYRLNYPPEEAQTVIREQTRSTFLEEVVHPLRESIYINGFKPREEKDAIFIKNRNWLQKITVRYVPSNPIARSTLILTALFLVWLVIGQWTDAVKVFFKRKKK